MYILGLDCGGTSTRALLTTKTGQPLGVGLGGPANYTVNGIAGVLSSVEKASEQALLQAGLDLDLIQKRGVVLSLGVSGAARPADLQALRQAFQKRGFSQVAVSHDAAIAHLGALSGADGVVVIAGTGSIAYGVRGQKTARVGGWGYLLGDEGSAFKIALQAIGHILRGYDGREAVDGELEAAALDYFQVGQVQGLVPLIYKKPIDRVLIGGFSAMAAALAQNGNALCQEIFAEAGRQLGQLAVAALQRLKLADTPGRIAACGGVFKAGSLLLGPMQEKINLKARQQKLTLPDFDPVVGAVFLGLPSPLEISRAAARLRLEYKKEAFSHGTAFID